MAARISLQVSPAHLAVEPDGPGVSAIIVVRNDGSVVDELQLHVEGLDAGWYRLSTESVRLLPQGQAEVRLEVAVPAGALAGEHAFRVVASSRDHPEDTAAVEATVGVAAVGGLEVALAPRRVTTRRAGRFRIDLSNTGNAEQTVDLVVSDPGAGLVSRLAVDRVAIAPGETRDVPLDVRPRRRSLVVPATRAYPFSVSAFPAGAEAAEPFGIAGGELVYRAPLAWLGELGPRARVLALALVGLALVAALAVWFLGAPRLLDDLLGGSDVPNAGAEGSATPAGAGGAMASGAGGTDSAAQFVMAAAPLIGRFGLNPDGATASGDVSLVWDVQGADEVRVERRPSGAAGAVERVEYTLVARNATGSASRSLDIYVIRAPTIEALAVDVESVVSGEAVRLQWQTERADRIFLDGEPLPAGAGVVELRPEETRDYVLRAVNAAGETTRRVRVTVNTPTPVPTATPVPTDTPVPTATTVPAAVPTATTRPAATTVPQPPTPVPTTVPPSPVPTGPPDVGPSGPSVVSGRTGPLHDRFGVNESFAASALAKDLGAAWTRWIIDWAAMQPNGPGDFNQFYIDEARLTRELGNGTRFAGMIRNTPAWAQRNPELGPRSVPRNLEAPVFAGGQINRDNPWANFVYQLAASYRGRIDVWMIWNEAEIPATGPNAVYNTWAGTPAEYYLLLKVAYQAIKAANPQAVVVLTPYSYHRDKQEGDGHSLPWFEAFVAAARADPQAAPNGFFFDALALNLYRNAHDLWDRYRGACSLQDDEARCLASTAPDDNYAIERADRKGFAQRLAELGLPGKPIWVTETNAMPYDDPFVPGWDPAARNDGFRITMDEQASYVIHAYALGLAAGYERIFWQAMQDDRPPVADELWGLVRFHDDPLNADPARRRPAYTAYQVASRYMAGADWAQLAVLLRPDDCGLPRDARLRPCWKRYAPRYEWMVSLVVFQRGDRRANVLWNQTDQPLTVSIPRRGSQGVAVDRAGNETPLVAQGDRWVVTLAPTHRHFDLFGGDPPGYFFVGGPPIIVVESGVPPNAPVEAPRRVA